MVVIGGGINGVAIARECARAGRSTLLVEQHDFGSGTTSRSTRIIHGGLRYLEHGELGLVRESLRERERLLAERPNLVHPIRFALALPRGGRHTALAIRAGLWMYARIGGRSSGASKLELYRIERLLDSGAHWSLFAYDDAQCEFPELLLAEWLCEAVAAGAVARNYTRVLDVTVAEGRVRGVRLRDELSGLESKVEAGWVVNATGPWVDGVASASGIATGRPMVGGVRGSHIVLPRSHGAPDMPAYCEAPDGRPIFAIPWNGQLLVGTTEVRDSGDPAQASPSNDEIEYLLQAVNRIFPRAGYSRDDIQFAFAGIRPLPYEPERAPSDVSRKAVLRDHKHDGAAGMISVIGGKLTTAASLARQCAARIGTGCEEREPFLAGTLACHALEHRVESWARQMSNVSGLEIRSARAIAEWHGRKALRIARRAAEDPLLRAPLCGHSPHVVAEAVEAMESECAMQLGDILLRRVPVALGACWSAECSREAAARIALVAGWDKKETQRQYYKFEQEREQFLHPPQRQPSPQPVKRAA